MRAPCGYWRSKKGKPFNKETIRIHIRGCQKCKSVLENVEHDGVEYPLYDLIAGEDWSDGAYWALAHELGEW